MKNIKVTTLHVFDEALGAYEYDRRSTLTLSEEHFDKAEAQELTARFLAIAVGQGLGIQTSTSVKEIPEDEEESFKQKYENLKKESNDHWSQRSKLNKEIESLKTQVETLKSVCPETHTETPIDIDPDYEAARDDLEA